MSKSTIKKTVCVGYLSPGDIRHEFVDSLLGTYIRHQSKGLKYIRAFVSLQSGPRVAEARSQIVDEFAKTNCDWLWMIDADMHWEPDALERLLQVAQNHQARIVGGLCFGGRHDAPMFPTIYRLIEDEINGVGTEIVHDYPIDTQIKVGATGAAFLLVHKSVFVEMRQAFGKLPDGKENPYPWFVEASRGGRPIGEDISFCLKAHALGIPIWLDTGIKVGHMKMHELTEAKYLIQRAKIKATNDKKLELP